MRKYIITLALSIAVFTYTLAQIDTFYNTMYFLPECRFYTYNDLTTQPDTVLARSIDTKEELMYSLCSYKNLHCLRINYTYPERLKMDKSYNFKGLPITFLEVSNCKSWDEGGVDDLYLDSLKSIYAAYSKIDSLPKFISKCRNLKSLMAWGYLINFKETIDLPNSLVCLRIGGTFKKIPQKVLDLPNLKYLELERQNDYDIPFENTKSYDFSKLAKLSYLSIDMPLKKQNISDIATLKNLETLSFDTYEGDVSDLAELNKLPNLKVLYINTMSVEDKIKLNWLLPHIDVAFPNHFKN